MFTRTKTRRTAVQLGLVVLLAAGGGLLGGSRYATDMVRDQLVAQRITFPPKGPALSPEKYPGLQRYAGRTVDDGPKAKAFADQYIAAHLKNIADGKTYSEVSAASRANPDDRRLAGQRQALFEGETLRGLLLSAWGWSVVARIAGIAAYAAFAGAGLLLLGAIAVALARSERRSEIPAGPDLAGIGLPA
ncbi:MAG TPA: hypothetical protein VHF27_02470 [Acidimicrobiales bacterium]|nr:hypothetical protein [Acidimicrobiales bacterium]